MCHKITSTKEKKVVLTPYDQKTTPKWAKKSV